MWDDLQMWSVKSAMGQHVRLTLGKVWRDIMYYGRGGDVASVNIEIRPSVADYWRESSLSE